MINIAKTIDLAVLKPNRLKDDLIQACRLARKYKVASVCVRPVDISLTKILLCNSKVLTSTVIDFPHGGQITDIKVNEVLRAIATGTQELDVVMDIAAFLDGRYDYVRQSLNIIVSSAKDIPVKVIIETGYLTPNEIITASQLVEESGAAYVKTCTGFGPRGVAPSDIYHIMSAVSIPVKASGGIKTYAKAAGLVCQGCKRLGIGWESIENILKEAENASTSNN